MRVSLLLALFSLACEPEGVPDDETECGFAGCEDTGSNELDGAGLYSSTCASCHGPEGTGIEGSGPDIVHELHHTDAKLIDVILNGDGDMAPVDVTEDQAQLIVDYMREAWE